jgi:hypothetical protein
MLTTTSFYRQLAQGYVRPLSWEFKVSFDKQFDPDIKFFTLDDSVLDGTDILAPSDNNVIAQWDQYEYVDYSNRIITMEWQREEQFPFSVTQAMADVVLNNYDGYFTRDSGSPIDSYLLPQRPLRLLAGFGGSNLPQFVGLSTTSPQVDRMARTASLHAIDFLSYLFSKPLDQTVIMEDYTTDEVLDELFQLFGLSTDQYILDVGFNRIPFVFFEKGKNLGEAIKELMEAELGSLYMDENGIIIFRNRSRISGDPVYSFNGSNIVSYETSDESDIINVVEIKANVRVVQGEQPVYNLMEPLELPGSITTELLVSFEDPVTSLSSLSYFNYVANTEPDNSGTYVTGDITFDTIELFNTAAKLTISNDSGETAYLTVLSLYGTPAIITKNIYLRSQDDDSVEKFEEQVYTIENDYIQSDSAAESVALSLLNYYKEYSSIIDMEVKGTHDLQVGDPISVAVDDIDDTFIITKIVDILDNSKFTQRIRGKIFNIPDFFTLDDSVLDGTEILAP